jgi:hypothetical protein
MVERSAAKRNTSPIGQWMTIAAEVWITMTISLLLNTAAWRSERFAAAQRRWGIAQACCS